VTGVQTCALPIWASMHLEYLALSEAHYERYFVQPLSFDE
jgi:hypothetical protein